jgi:hypothetical protein
MTVLACACNRLYVEVTLRVGVTVDTSVKDVRDIATGAAGGTHHLRALGESGPVAARGPGRGPIPVACAVGVSSSQYREVGAPQLARSSSPSLIWPNFAEVSTRSDVEGTQRTGPAVSASRPRALGAGSG